MYVYLAMRAWFSGVTEVVVDGAGVERDVELCRGVRVSELLPKSGEAVNDTFALPADERDVPGCCNDVLVFVSVSVSIPGPASQDNPLVVVVDVAFLMMSDVQVTLPEIPPRVVE